MSQFSNWETHFDFGTFYVKTNFNLINGHKYNLFFIAQFGTLIMSKKGKWDYN